MMRQDMKIWITRHIWEKGIEEIDNAVRADTDSAYFKIPGTWHLAKEFKDAWHTKEEAVKRANILKTKKVAALEKKLAQIKAAVFC